jgi:hypothetical protein
MNAIGNIAWNIGFEDAMKGNKCSSENADYLNGYSRGYETGERQSANQEWVEKNCRKRHNSSVRT